jgi:uncharacterized protein (DUF58 family)
LNGHDLLDANLLHKLDRLSLASRRRLGRLNKGERRSQQKGASLEFVDYRRYVPGDDPRQVDWNLYGRSGALFVKQFEAEEVLSTHLLLDSSRSMDWGTPNKLEYGRRLAAALGYLSLASYDRLGVGIIGDGRSEETFGPAWGPKKVGALFAFLAGGRPAGQTDLGTAIARYFQQHKGAGVTVLISDLLSPSAEAAVKRLATLRHEVVVLHVLAPEEELPAADEGLRLVDRETGQSVEVYLDQRAIELYRERLAEWSAALQRLCSRQGAVYLRLSSATPLEQAIYGVLKQRGVLQ